MLRRRLWWLFATLPLLTMAVATCGDGALKMNETPEAGLESGALGESVCPDAAPEAGEGCVVPEGTTCAFGACGTALAQCSQGTWRYGGSSAPRPVCPATFPASQSQCPPCWPATMRCIYGSEDCDAPDASTNKSTATCPQGLWVITTIPCAKDAGADVQHDADADAD